ncbi:Trk system potassium transporter TrkA [Candidatus Neomarinimicrobiota bacterium]
MSVKIVIIGAGEVGFNLAKQLSQEDYDITVVDTDPAKIKHASETLDVSTVEGNGASPSILRQAQVGTADIFLALTRIDEVNLIASQLARELGVKKVIARLRNTEYTSKKAVLEPARFGIDIVIHPELAIVGEVERLLHQSSALEVKEFEGGKVQLIGVRLDPSSPLLDRTLEEVSQANGDIPHKIIALNRAGQNFIPRGDAIYQADDVVYVMGEEADIPAIVTMLGKPQREVKTLMILGAGNVGKRLASRFQDELDVKLVEAKKAAAWEIAPLLMNTMVLHGDGTDIDFLISENIHEMDSFIAVTEDEKTNLITGLLAKQLGAKHVIVHLSTTSYLPIARRIGIDAAISKNMATVEAILRVVKSSHERAVSSFEDLEMEAVELSAMEGSKVTKKPVKEISFPVGALLGAIIRNSKVIIPSGESQILEGDRVLLFMQDVEAEKIQKLFS